MPKSEEENKAKGCIFALVKLLALAIGLFLLVRERFDAILRTVNPWWWSLSVLGAVFILFLIARYIYRR